MAPDIAKATAPDGRVILSGILTEQADEVVAGFKAAGLTCETQPPLEGWVTLIGKPG